MAGSIKSSRNQDRDDKEREFRFLIALTTVAFLPIAAFARLIPRAAGSISFADTPRRSVYREARESAQTVIPFAFMG